MIVYNIRANGPYEYEKFVLLLGQLHNLCEDAREKYRQSDVLRYDRILSGMVEEITAADNMLNKVAAMQEALR